MPPYNKPYLTIPNQVALLTGRGMAIPDVPKAEEYLRRIGYYRLSAYWYPFRQSTHNADGTITVHDNFKDGADFKTVTDLYAFDKTLRLIALDAIERIEISIRTEAALAVGRHDPWAHRDPSRLDGRFTAPAQAGQQSNYQVWLGKLDGRAATSKEEFADHFRTKYAGSHMPIWIAVELLEFGPLSHFLSGMKFSDLMTVSASYGGLQPHLIKSWIRALCGVRNVCAHHSRFWNRPLVDQPRLPKHNEVPHLNHLLGDPDSNKRLYAAFAIMRALLRTVNPRTKWSDRLKAHLATFPHSPYVTLASAGFPNDWQNLPLWN